MYLEEHYRVHTSLWCLPSDEPPEDGQSVQNYLFAPHGHTYSVCTKHRDPFWAIRVSIHVHELLCVVTTAFHALRHEYHVQLVEGAGGSSLNDASEIAAGVESVIRHLDRNADSALSRSDLLTYWKRLGAWGTVFRLWTTCLCDWVKFDRERWFCSLLHAEFQWLEQIICRPLTHDQGQRC